MASRPRAPVLHPGALERGTSRAEGRELSDGRQSGGGETLSEGVGDTERRRRGRRECGCDWHRDPAANSRDGAVAWGNNWVTLGMSVNLAYLTRPVCLLVLYRLYQQRRPGGPKRTPDPERPARPQLAQDSAVLARRFPDRESHLVADAAYTNRALRRLPENVTFTGRLRATPRCTRCPAPPRRAARRAGHCSPALAHRYHPATRCAHTVRRYAPHSCLRFHACHAAEIVRVLTPSGRPALTSAISPSGPYRDRPGRWRRGGSTPRRSGSGPPRADFRPSPASRRKPPPKQPVSHQRRSGRARAPSSPSCTPRSSAKSGVRPWCEAARR